MAAMQAGQAAPAQVVAGVAASEIPEYIRQAWRQRGLCERCGGPGGSYWQSERGPLLCWPHIEARRAAYDDRRQGR